MVKGKYLFLILFFSLFSVNFILADFAPVSNKMWQGDIAGFNNSRHDDPTFACNASDDYGLTNITFFIWNASSSLVINYTTNITGVYNETSLVLILPNEGIYYWNCLAYDNSSNSSWGSGNWTFTYDDSSPTLTVNSPLINQNFSNRLVTINISVNDTWGLNLTTVSLYNSSLSLINSTSNSTTGTYNLILGVPYDGVFLLNVSAYDGIFYNAKNESIFNITIDTTEPVLTINSPLNNSIYYINQSIKINFSSIDALIGVGSKWYNNGSANITFSAMSSILFDSVGLKNVTFYSNDSLGNLKSVIFSINITDLPTNSTIADLNQSIIVNENITRIIVPFNSSLKNVSIPSMYSNSSFYLDLNQIITGNNVTIPNNFVFTRTNGNVNHSLEISRGIVLRHFSWDGLFYMPKVNFTNTSFSMSGALSIPVVVSFGSGSELNFSSPIKITLGGMIGKRAAWTRGTSTLTNITRYCDSLTDPTNINQNTYRECYINHTNGNDLVIWTYHLTDFAAYVPNTTVVNSSDDDEEEEEEEEESSTTSSSSTTTVVSSYWTSTIGIPDNNITSGYSRSLKSKERIRIRIGNIDYYIGVISVSSSLVRINVSGKNEEVLLDSDDEKRFEVNYDNFYDIYVKVNSITNSTNALITIKSINEVISETVNLSSSPVIQNQNFNTSSNQTEVAQKPLDEENKNLVTYVLNIFIALIFISLVIIVYVIIKLKKFKKTDLVAKVDSEKLPQIKQVNVPVPPPQYKKIKTKNDIGKKARK